MNSSNLYFDERTKRLVELIDPSPKDRILVVGTGVCPKIEIILHNHFGCSKITSGDIDQENVKNGRSILPQISFIELDAQKRFPLKDHCVDKVILTEVLEHLKNERVALSEIKRVLSSTGQLILTVPRTRWFNLFNPITWVQHEREYTPESIKKVLEDNGFVTDEIFVGGSFMDLLSLWVHLLIKYSTGRVNPNHLFRRSIDNTYLRNFKGKGTDILVRARKVSKIA